MRIAEEIIKARALDPNIAMIALVHAAQSDALESAIVHLQRARENGETDMRQVINWIRQDITAHRLDGIVYEELPK